jgi:conjugative transfer region protein (TIGR03748 family)
MRVLPKTVAATLIATFFFSNAFATDNAANIGRYLSVAQKPLSSQRDLLSQTIQLRFPQPVQTIGDAIDHLLRYSGYSLVSESKRTSVLKNTLQKTLPLVDREFGPMTLRDALTILIGTAFTLVEDPLNREVDFQLKSHFSKKLHAGV